MKKRYSLLLLAGLWTGNLQAQTFLNGSFENTTAQKICNYNKSNADINSLLPHVNAFGTYEAIDIQVENCYVSTITDGTYALAIANQPNNNTSGEAVALELSENLIEGKTYEISFSAYSITDFGPQGDLLIGVSTVNNTFGTELYTAKTVEKEWKTFTFEFTAPNGGKFITVQPVTGVDSWNSIDNFKIKPVTVTNSQEKLNQSVTIYPSPANSFIIVDGITTSDAYQIYDLIGVEVQQGTITNGEQIDIQHLPTGMYILKLNNGVLKTFLKK